MRELLAHPVMRRFVYQWSRNQFCSESVKFLAACDMLGSLADKSSRAAAVRSICENYISSEGSDSVNIAGSSRKTILARVRAAASDDELLALLPGLLEQPRAEVLRVVEYDLYPQFSLLLEEVYAEREAGTARPLSPTGAGAGGSSHVSPRSASSPPDGAGAPAAVGREDYARLRYVNEVAQDAATLKELLLFCTDKIDQDAVLFVTLVQEYK
jgi:hypothetical protein